jgi:hypothetical protein
MKSRYRTDRRIRGGRCLASHGIVNSIRQAIRNGSISTSPYTSKEGERLDILAARFLGDSTMWWVLAASSNIGWSLQIPPGTQINIPNDISRINAVI